MHENKKRFERMYAQYVATGIKANWKLISDRESPDFIVDENGYLFGLEVTQTFKGPRTKSGSVIKQKEFAGERILGTLKEEYEAKTDTFLKVQLSGPPTVERARNALDSLYQEGFESKPNHYQANIILNDGTEIYARKFEYRSEWFWINHRVGWVETIQPHKLNAEIKSKSLLLNKYRENTGFNDIRLLIVANLVNNSGKLAWDDGIKQKIELCGFTKIYLYLFPEHVIVLD